jgi:hypothetical protein|tara:strand:- start:1892 stop:2347 length:456 start_codon:yes stop_codon:yes gene_type:complete
MTNHFDLLSKGRVLILKVINDFSMDQLNKIPEGFNNNIAWNVAHLLVTQQLLCYKFSGLPLAVSDKMVKTFVKGTSPQEDISHQEFEEIKRLFIELPEKLAADFNNELFTSYTPYTTSVNVTISDISSAIVFNNFHEGIHLGIILGLRKLV